MGEAAGADHLGARVYELGTGDAMPFHYHLQREELLVVLSGEIELRKGGIYDAAHPADRRFGALFDLGSARSGYAGGEPKP